MTNSPATRHSIRPWTCALLVMLGLHAGVLRQVADAQSAARGERGGRTEIAVEDHPGFVAFDALDQMFGEDALDVHISIKDAMLRLVAAATRESEPELATMIGALRAVEVLVYEIVDADGRREARGLIKNTAERLRTGGWEPAIDIRLEGQGGFLYFRFPDGRDGSAGSDDPVGLAGIFLDGDEAVFINIVGTIDPQLLGRLAARFNISLLDELDAALPKTPARRQR